MASTGFHELLSQARSGERSALDRLMTLNRPYLIRVANGLADGACASQSTSDLVQEAELRAWQKLEEFDGGTHDDETQAKFRAWMAQILRRLSIDLHRRRNALKRKSPAHGVVPIGQGGSTDSAGTGGRVDPPGESPTASAAFRSKERSLSIRQALEGIPDETNREIVRLRFFEGLTLRQVAERVDLAYETVKKRFQSTLRRLEDLLEGLIDDG